MPVGAVHVKHLGHPAPADIFDQQSFFVRRSRTIPGSERPQDVDGLEILLELLLEAAFAKPVGIGDAIAVKIPGHARRQDSSAGSRM